MLTNKNHRPDHKYESVEAIRVAEVAVIAHRRRWECDIAEYGISWLHFLFVDVRVRGHATLFH
jgi:hypothetical protein